MKNQTRTAAAICRSLFSDAGHKVLSVREDMYRDLLHPIHTLIDEATDSNFTTAGGADMDAHENADADHFHLQQAFTKLCKERRWTNAQALAIETAAAELFAPSQFDASDLSLRNRLLLFKNEYDPLNEFTTYLVDDVLANVDWLKLGMTPRALLRATTDVFDHAAVRPAPEFYNDDRPVNYRPFVVARRKPAVRAYDEIK